MEVDGAAVPAKASNGINEEEGQSVAEPLRKQERLIEALQPLCTTVSFDYGVSKPRIGPSPPSAAPSSTLRLRCGSDRMRNGSVLMVNFRGIATEACKNIVLAGTGSLTILDDEDVDEEDLGAGFFLREEDIGKKVRSHLQLIPARVVVE